MKNAWRAGMMAMAMVSGSASAAELVLYSIPSPHGISWKSPRALLFSRLKNELTLQHAPAHKLGHVAIELRSEAGNYLTGMTDTGQVSYAKQIFQQGLGLGVVLESVPGRLQRADELEPDLRRRFASGRVSYMRFRISEQSAARVGTFITEFHDKGYDQHYGGTLEPLNGEGGGCTAFGTSVMKVAGVLDDHMTKTWSQDVLLPKPLVGGAGTKVSVAKMIFSKLSGRWAKKGEPSDELKIYDPGAIASFIDGQHDSLPKSGATRFGMKMKPEQVGKAKGIFVDARHVPTPRGPIFAKK